MGTKIVFLLIVASILLQANNKAYGDKVNNDDLISKWCSRTELKELCDYVATNSRIPDILKRTTDPFVRSCLIGECSEGYIQAIDNLKSLDFSIINRETYYNLTRVSYGYNNPDFCEHCFKEGPPGLSIPPELASDNRNLENAPIIIAGIVNLMVCGTTAAC
ncbi:hypothetical protein CASFOL_038562 [Castilleja foliolosa]|uniref:Uncharacterized protein n=1 Tax=Castilleja foliolosa TaxID=1961234 RepID=A0ABD3BM98_9LAMI